MKPISVFQAMMILVGSIGFMHHVILVPYLIELSGRDSWFALLIMFIPCFLWLLLVFVLCRRVGKTNLADWLRESFGLWAAWPLTLLACAILLLANYVTLKETVDWITTTILDRTPAGIVCVLLVALCVILARSGMQTLSICAIILLPLVILLGFFVMSGNLPNKDYSRLLPVLANGWGPVWSGMLFTAQVLAELILVVLINTHVEKPIRYWQLVLLGFILLGLTMGPITGGIAEFGPVESAKQRFPAFEQWKILRIGQLIQHVDFFSVYQWMVGAFIRMALTMFLAVDLLAALLPASRVKQKHLCWLLGAVMILLFIFVPLTDIQYYTWLKTFYFPYCGAGGACLAVILFILIWIPGKKGGQRHAKYGRV